MNAMIHFIDVHKSFGSKQVLAGINLEIKEREVVVIIGPSGFGKSTMLRCVNRLVEIDRGEVIVGAARRGARGSRAAAARAAVPR